MSGEADGHDLIVTADPLWDYLQQMEWVWFFPDPTRPLDVTPFTLRPGPDSLQVVAESGITIGDFGRRDFLQAANLRTPVERGSSAWYARVVLQQLFPESASWKASACWDELETQAMGYRIPDPDSWEAALLTYLEAGAMDALLPFMDETREPHRAHTAGLMVALDDADYEKALKLEVRRGRLSLSTLVWYKRKLGWPFLHAAELLALTQVRDSLTKVGQDAMASVQTHLDQLLDELAESGEQDPLRYMLSRFSKGNLTAARLRRMIGETDDFRATQEIERWSTTSLGKPMAEEWETPVIRLPGIRLPRDPPLTGHVNLNFCLTLAIYARLGELARAAENRYRLEIGLPSIGGGWVTQRILHNRLKDAYPDEKIVAEASPDWLGLQRFDTFFPERNLAVEYNGLQHYEAVDFFGGDDALNEVQRRDAIKRALCRDNDCTLVEIRYDVSMDDAVAMVARALKRSRN